jgi:hypothetical protein
MAAVIANPNYLDPIDLRPLDAVRAIPWVLHVIGHEYNSKTLAQVQRHVFKISVV